MAKRKKVISNNIASESSFESSSETGSDSASEFGSGDELNIHVTKAKKRD